MSTRDPHFYYQVALKFHRKNDADIIEMLESQPNRQRYIKEALRQDISYRRELESSELSTAEIDALISSADIPSFDSFENDAIIDRWFSENTEELPNIHDYSENDADSYEEDIAPEILPL